MQLAVWMAWTVLAAATLYCFAMRAFYPYCLEWMEGNQWLGSYRLAHSLPIYADPSSTGYLPHPYPPLHTWLGSLAVRLMGEELWPVRLTSILLTLVCALCIARAVWSQSRNRPAAWTAACMFLGMYGVLDTWYDLVRVDIAFVAVVLAGLTIWAEAPRKPWHSGLGLLLISLGLLAKQSALFMVLFGCIYCIAHRLPGWRVLVPSVVLLQLGLHAYLHLSTDGWYTFWVWRLPAAHEIQWQRFFPGGVARAMWIAALPLLAAFLTRNHPAPGRTTGTLQALVRVCRSASIWTTALVAAFIGCGMAYSKQGADINNWMLFAALVCVVCFSNVGWRAVNGHRLLPGALLLIQAALCVYNPAAKIPTPTDRKAGDDLVAAIRSIEGDVLVLDDPYLAFTAGKQPYIGGMSLADLQYSGYPPPAALVDCIRQREFAALLVLHDYTDSSHQYPIPSLIREVCTGAKIEVQYPSSQTFMPKAGGAYRPSWLLLRPGESFAPAPLRVGFKPSRN